MLTKSFDELRRVDVTQYLTSRDESPNVKYLPWAACKHLLHKNGAETVLFEPVLSEDGSSLRMSRETFKDKNGVTNRCYEVLVHIIVDNIEWHILYPVMNGDKPVKDNSMNQQRVHAAIRRAFVKGVAERLGLGFDLWMKQDDVPDAPVEEDLSRHSLMKCKQRMQELVTTKINNGLDFNIIADRLNMDPDTLRSKFALYGELVRLEQAIWEMKP